MIYKNKLVNIQIEKSSLPWLKIFTNDIYKEFSQCPSEVKLEILRLLEIIEKEMIDYYNPAKINIASFGNYLPHVHFHIMARFEDDEFFPECVWGMKKRQSDIKLPNFEKFIEILKTKF